MKILIFGTGWMGCAVAYDLLQFGKDHKIGLADKDSEQLNTASSMIGPHAALHPVEAGDEKSVARLFDEYDLVISAVPYRFNTKLASLAVSAKTHFLDLGGNSDIVREQLRLDERARSADITVIPNCGLAPGLSNILAMTGLKQLQSVESIQARVGGLPQNPRPPLKYQLMFSVEGLLNEYLEEAEIIDNGTRRFVPSLTGLEPLSFGKEFPDLEAFYTSGGLSLLPELLEGNVKHLSYKTIRYSGHCTKFKTLLDLGFAGSEPVMIGGGIHTSRELFTELLRKKLSGSDPDVVLFRVDIAGETAGRKKILRYEMTDRYDPESKMTAMMRTTAYPTSVIALMLADGSISTRGALLPEQVVDGGLLIDELRKRNIIIRKNFIEDDKIKATEMEQ